MKNAAQSGENTGRDQQQPPESRNFHLWRWLITEMSAVTQHRSRPPLKKDPHAMQTIQIKQEESDYA